MRRNQLSKVMMLALLCAMIVFALPTLPADAQGGRRTYVVQPGDTLFSIAARFGVSVSELATINGFYDINQVAVGQVLVLPQSAVVVPTQVPVVSRPVVVQPAPGTVITTVTRYVAYTVRAGDTLASIAARYKTTIAAILSVNNILNADLVYVGQYLLIPIIRTTVVPGRSTTRPASGRTYIVRHGDNLFAIAARFGRDVYAIARANGILNLNYIFVGQVLIIP